MSNRKISFFVQGSAARATIRSMVTTLAFLSMVVLATGRAAAVDAARAEARAKPGADKVAWEKIDAGRNAKTPKEAEALYQAAETHARNEGDLWAWGAAINCRASLAVNTGKLNEAAAILRPLPLDPKDPENFVYKYNLGRVLEKLNDRPGALKAYEASLSLRPDFESARDRLYEQLLESSPPDIPRALWAGDLLMRNGQSTLVASRLLDLLDKWGNAKDAMALLVQLACVYGGGEWDLDRFQSTEESRVVKVGSQAEALRPMVTELIDAFKNNKSDFHEWKKATGGQPAISRLLVALADGDLAAEPPRSAIAADRYLNAWTIDSGNTAAPVSYVSVLTRFRSVVDPESIKFNQFVKSLITEKSELYALPTRKPDDWFNLLTLHTILAEIFDRNPQPASKGDIYTSIYHWQQAVRVQQQIHDSVEPTFPLSPQLYLGLANAQSRESARLGESWESYIRAAELCQTNADKSLGLAAIRSAEAVGGKLKLDPEKVLKLNKLAQQIEKLPTPRSGEPESRPSGIRWLPPEYRLGTLPPEKLSQLGETNEKYEKRMREAPMQRGDIAKERAKMLDGMLDGNQLEQVKKARENRDQIRAQ